jgi:hypothetical protein
MEVYSQSSTYRYNTNSWRVEVRKMTKMLANYHRLTRRSLYILYLAFILSYCKNARRIKNSIRIGIGQYHLAGMVFLRETICPGRSAYLVARQTLVWCCLGKDSDKFEIGVQSYRKFNCVYAYTDISNIKHYYRRTSAKWPTCNLLIQILTNLWSFYPII